MKLPSKYFVLMIVGLLWSGLSHGEAPVWKVTGENGNTLYLAGTFHLLGETDHPLPEEFAQAYAAANTVVFETDIGAASSMEFQNKAAAMMISKTGPLKNALSSETYQLLATFLQERGINIENLAPFTPQAVALTVTALEYQRMGMRADLGVDQIFFQKARSDGKTVIELETPDEQLAIIAAMGAGNEDDMIRYTLRDLANSQEYLDELKSYWRNGNLDRLEEFALKELQQDFNETYQSILVDRNNKWLPKIETMLDNNTTETVFVGALHLVGGDGLLAQLKTQGYRIEKL